MAEDRTTGAMPRSRLGVLGLATVLGSAFIGFNTLVTSCASERGARDAAQLHSIEERERFWTEAMQELSDIAKDRGKVDVNYDARCRLLARRTAPFASAANDDALLTNAGDPEPSPEIAKLSDRVDKLQAEFALQIADRAIVGPICSGEFDVRKLSDVANKDALEKVARVVAKSAPPNNEVPYGSIAARDDLITLSPLSAKGIDVDVFWCDTAREAETNRNFKNALLLGQRLAGYATSGYKLTYRQQSDPVGRVRVRVLPGAVRLRLVSYDDVLGRNVLHGQRPVQPFMAAIAQDTREAEVPDLADLATRPPTALDTPWKVSAFICGANTQPSANAAPLPPATSTKTR